MGDVKLLPCPFCGAIDHRVKHVSTYTSAGDGAGVSNSYRVVECRCSAHGPLARTHELAIAAWNTLLDPALTPAQQAAEEMVEALTKAMACEACEGSGVLLYPPACNCYEDPTCTHKETEAECACCGGTGMRDIPEGVAALAKAGKP